MSLVSIKKLTLTNFRNHEYLKINVDERPVIITGENGVGKTNILEAISFLAPGRGLKNAKICEVAKDGIHNWGVSATIKNDNFETNIGTGKNPKISAKNRIIRINDEQVKSQACLADVLSLIWLTPQMDGIFIGSSSDRRKFLDRMIYSFDPEHASRVFSYEHAMRERAKLLQSSGDIHWINILEQKMAENSVAIADARIQITELIADYIEKSTTSFTKPYITAQGYTEDSLNSGMAAIDVEEKIKCDLKDLRMKDKFSGRTNCGCHKADLVAHHFGKNTPAAQCSTGEQKAMLLSIIIAKSKAKSKWKNQVPIILLDEVVSHLDELKKNELLQELMNLKAQIWITGVDKKIFSFLDSNANFIEM